MDINKALNNYIYYLKYERESSNHTLKAYVCDINGFIYFLTFREGLNEIDIKSINRNTARSYLEYLNEVKKFKGSTIRRKMTSLISFFSYLEIEEIIQQNPFQKIKMPKKNKSLPIFLSSNELDHLIKVTEKNSQDTPFRLRDLILLSILRYTGCRRSELLSLKWEDIDIKGKSIKIFGKGNKERLVPIHPNLIRYLTLYQDQQKQISGLLVNGRNLNMLSNSALRKILLKYLTLAGLQNKNITPHKIRHSFASELLNNGIDIRIIQQWLGHESITSTAIYTHVNFQHLLKVWGE